MQKEYKTVLNSVTVEFEEKKSVFIAHVKPIKEEQEAVDFISSLKTKYWDATHNVYAYVFGQNSSIQRFSDDGEPSGTAGMPVLDVIRKNGLLDVVVVVTRYFGGTLLGAGGLVRAYSKSAALGIETAKIIMRILCVVVRITIEYNLLGKIQNILNAKGYKIKAISYELDIEISVYVKTDELDAFNETIIEACNANCIIEELEKEYQTILS